MPFHATVPVPPMLPRPAGGSPHRVPIRTAPPPTRIGSPTGESDLWPQLSPASRMARMRLNRTFARRPAEFRRLVEGSRAGTSPQQILSDFNLPPVDISGWRTHDSPLSSRPSRPVAVLDELARTVGAAPQAGMDFAGPYAGSVIVHADQLGDADPDVGLHSRFRLPTKAQVAFAPSERSHVPVARPKPMRPRAQSAGPCLQAKSQPSGYQFVPLRLVSSPSPSTTEGSQDDGSSTRTADESFTEPAPPFEYAVRPHALRATYP